MASKEKTKALAYLRTSSAANVGTDKDSDKRQRTAIAAFATSHGFQIVEEFHDPGVSGADPIETRPGLCASSTRSKATACERSLSRTCPALRVTS